MAHPDNHLVTARFDSGVNNRYPETKTASPFAREMVNLDASEGVVAARTGRLKRLDAAAPHSLWSHELLDFALFAQDDALLLIGSDYEPRVLRTGLQRREVSYAYVAGKVFWSNGVDTGVVTQAGATADWGVETPAAIFTASALADGGLDAGEYQVTLTYMAGREESGAPASFFVDVPQGGGISLANVPTPRSAAVTAVRVYLSGAGDPRLFHVRDLAVGMSSVALGAGPREQPLVTQFLTPAPAGRYLLARNSRIFMASGKLLRWTESLRYGLQNPEFNFIKLPDAVTCVCAPETEGLTLFIGTAKKTYVFRGNDIETASLTAAGHVGIVPGSMTMVPHETLALEGLLHDVPVWLGTNGAFYAGTTQGVLLLNKFAAALVYDKAAVTMSERGFLTVAGRGGKPSGLTIKDRMVARVVEIG